MKPSQRQWTRRVALTIGILGLVGGSAAGQATAQEDGDLFCFGKKATISGGQRVENTDGDTDEQFTRVYIDGTEGDDVIVGTDAIDIVYAKGGDDRVCALGGNDFVDGGDGFDLCAGGAGTDNVSDTCEWGARRP
jgi:Ca2+-binding RTX toxin-like protein